MSKITCVATLTFMAALVILAPVATAGEADTKKPCCFTNPRYTGVCEVQPGETETCASILAYLNNQQAVGKVYCGNTPIRGGWASVACSSGQSAQQNAGAMCTQEPIPSD